MVSAPTNLPSALAAALAERGHEVVVHTRRVDPDAPERQRLPSGVVVQQIVAGPVRPIVEQELAPWLGEFGRALAAAWRDDRPDVVHAFSWASGLAASAARQQLRESTLIRNGAAAAPLPVVLTFTAFGAEQHRRQGPVDPGLANRIRLEVALARSVAAVIAGSDDEVEELARMGVPRERVTLVPPGVDVSRFTPYGPSAERTDAPRLVAVGDLTPSSGFDTVIAALRGLPGVELVIAGTTSGDASEELERLRAGAEQLELADRVTFAHSAVRDPAARSALLRSADAVVCVPWHGPVGAGPVLEAMACGIPVVATAVGAVSDVVVDGVTGVQAPPRRPDQLATVIRGLLGDPVRCLGFGAAGADRARSRYEWARIAVDAERAYRALVPAALPAVDDELIHSNE
ncbi:Glycosyltransferase involved in cell wall bisynthesis [Cryptosporangium aurantiacum]|uniref:Glycosyltransferase involved in cell wall bisynthesis n=2 Tax=Cryptosporangium aurantiacum TaxID=134849 RepID=A0A1M7RPN0_9ACTN|nr:Glycosyltransferase involved in cell wall bisynthesis [Cryptosporangium aurantiacum]